MDNKTNELTLRVGATYRAKRPQRIFLGGFDDRTILHISPMGSVQYDGPSVRMGRHSFYCPLTTTEKFLRWAKWMRPETPKSCRAAIELLKREGEKQ